MLIDPSHQRIAPRRHAIALLTGLVILSATGGCALLPYREPVRVDVIDVQPANGEGMELRFTVKLRVQNPNDQPIEFDGLFAELDLRGSRLASGVSDQHGTVPRFGEAVLSLPMTVPLSAVIRQALGLVSGNDTRADYVVRGKLNGPLFGSVRFESRGELKLPA